MPWIVTLQCFVKVFVIRHVTHDIVPRWKRNAQSLWGSHEVASESIMQKHIHVYHWVVEIRQGGKNEVAKEASLLVLEFKGVKSLE